MYSSNKLDQTLPLLSDSKELYSSPALANEESKTITPQNKAQHLLTLPTDLLNKMMGFLGHYPAEMPRDEKNIQAYCEEKQRHKFGNCFNITGGRHDFVTYNIFSFNREFYKLKGVARCFSSSKEIQDILLDEISSQHEYRLLCRPYSHRMNWPKKINKLGLAPALFCCDSAHDAPAKSAQQISCFTAAACYFPIGLVVNVFALLCYFPAAAVDAADLCCPSPERPAVTPLNLQLPSQSFFKPNHDSLLPKRLSHAHLSHFKYPDLFPKPQETLTVGQNSSRPIRANVS